MVTAFFVGTTIAQAVSVEWGGQLRPRFEYNEQAGFNQINPTSGVTDNGQREGDYFVQTRIRLNAKVDILPDTILIKITPTNQNPQPHLDYIQHRLKEKLAQPLTVQLTQN